MKGLRSSSTILYLGSREVPKAPRRGANLEGYARPLACAAPDNTPLWSYETGAPVRSVSVSSDGSHVTAGSDEHPREPLERSQRDLLSIRGGVVPGRQRDLNPRGGPARGWGSLESRGLAPDPAGLGCREPLRQWAGLGVWGLDWGLTAGNRIAGKSKSEVRTDGF